MAYTGDVFDIFPGMEPPPRGPLPGQTTDITAHGTPTNPITIQPISGFWKGYEPEPWWYSPTLKFNPKSCINERVYRVWGGFPGQPGVPNYPNDYYLNNGETSVPPCRPDLLQRPPTTIAQEETLRQVDIIVPIQKQVAAPVELTPVQEKPMAFVQTQVPAPQSILPAQRRTTQTVMAPAPSSDITGAILGGIGGLITGGPGGIIPGAIGGYLGTGTGSGESPSSPGVTHAGTGALTSGCPTGYEWDGTRCVQSGLGGTVARILPGGSTGALPQGNGYGQAVMGAFGVPALQPAQVGSTLYGPILRCPPGAVLGKDNLCYMKGSITNKQRKWPKPPRPLLSAGDMKTLRKVKSLENRVKKAWRAAGSPGQRKPCTHKKRR
jgi:hypothetical protein